MNTTIQSAIMSNKKFLETYKYFVEYIDFGVQCSDLWSERCLLDNLKSGEVKIISFSLNR